MLPGAYRAGCLLLQELRSDVVLEAWSGSAVDTRVGNRDVARDLPQDALIRSTGALMPVAPSW
jgi:hypothetical protein